MNWRAIRPCWVWTNFSRRNCWKRRRSAATNFSSSRIWCTSTPAAWPSTDAKAVASRRASSTGIVRRAMAGKPIRHGVPRKGNLPDELARDRCAGLCRRAVRDGPGRSFATVGLQIEGRQGIIHYRGPGICWNDCPTRLRCLPRFEVSRYPEYRGTGLQGRRAARRLDGQCPRAWRTDDDECRAGGDRIRAAQAALDCGLDGVVCSAHEAAAIRDQVGSRFLRVTPGIRLPEDAAGDQKRVMTPQVAIESGANYLVIGRSVTRAADPLAVLARVNREIAVPEA